MRSNLWHAQHVALELRLALLEIMDLSPPIIGEIITVVDDIISYLAGALAEEQGRGGAGDGTGSEAEAG